MMKKMMEKYNVLLISSEKSYLVEIDSFVDKSTRADI
jgi:hypothetical protein